MREKSDEKKLLEKRCLGSNGEYVGYIKANEHNSSGTASEIYDPIAGRTVDTLSEGETRFFWTVRFDDDTEEIMEQIFLVDRIVEQICTENHYPCPSRRLSTDFLVRKKNGSCTAYSVKHTRGLLNPRECRSEREKQKMLSLMIRQDIERCYWKHFNIDFRIIFSDEINDTKVQNIMAVMAFYDRWLVEPGNTEAELRYLIAHKFLKYDMETNFLYFPRMCRGKEKLIHDLFNEVVSHDSCSVC